MFVSKIYLEWHSVPYFPVVVKVTVESRLMILFVFSSCFGMINCLTRFWGRIFTYLRTETRQRGPINYYTVKYGKLTFNNITKIIFRCAVLKEKKYFRQWYKRNNNHILNMSYRRSFLWLSLQISKHLLFQIIITHKYTKCLQTVVWFCFLVRISLELAITYVCRQ